MFDWQLRKWGHRTVQASHQLINIDSDSDSLWNAELKHGIRNAVPRYSEILLCNQWAPSPADIESVVGIAPPFIAEICRAVVDPVDKSRSQLIANQPVCQT